ncbi:MAG: DegT/DnrJ/EryC1/StrS family aminotransferase [Alphaproteobacteria bacterium]|nr:DegT/DnrJ/EryC1/StrS family aminotransferase [Alphaproteobacteria bacterium]
MPPDSPIGAPCLVPFAQPDLTAAEIAAVERVMRSGWLIEGAVTQTLEKTVGEAVGNPRIVATNSATSAFLSLFMALGIGRGDEVIFPTWTFTSPPLMAHLVGATPVFVDIAESDLNIDAAAVAAAITPRTRAIVPTHFAGKPADLAALANVAHGAGVALIEDAAHAYGACYGGRPLGTCEHSQTTVFSTYATKCVTTAEGGLTAVASDGLRNQMRRAGRCGIDRGTFAREGDDDPFPDYDVVTAGIKASLPDVLAAIGLAQIERADAMRQRRTAIAARYQERLRGLEEAGRLRLPAGTADAGSVPSWHLYVVRLESDRPDAAAAIVRRMRRSGVQCSVHFKPLHRHPFWRDGNAVVMPVPTADRLCGRTVSLPVWSAMSDAQIDIVVEAVTTASADLS